MSIRKICWSHYTYINWKGFPIFTEDRIYYTFHPRKNKKREGINICPRRNFFPSIITCNDQVFILEILIDLASYFFFKFLSLTRDQLKWILI